MASREPALNIPPVVVAALAAMALVHGVLWGLFSVELTDYTLGLFAFIPARYDGSPVAGAFPGGLPADLWTFVTYSLFHADLNHLIFNAVWLLAFGTAVARRFGSARFLLFFVVTAAAGAVAHLIAHAGELYPMIGASAAISGCMAAAMRFVFNGGGPLGLFGAQAPDAYRVPALPLLVSLRDPRVFAFMAVWFGINLLVGLIGFGVGGIDQPVAWEAHLGGFVAGLILFPLFDPIGMTRRAQTRSDDAA